MPPPTEDSTTAWAEREHRVIELLALLPVLAGATSIGTALALGTATVGVLAVTLAANALLRPASPTAHFLLGTVVAAALVTCLDLACHAWLPTLHTTLGPFILLIAPTTVLFSHVRTVAARRSSVRTFSSVFAVLPVFIALGALREVIGRGSLLADVTSLAGLDGEAWRIELPGEGVLVAAFIPGALLALAALLALRNRRMRGRPQ